MLPKRVGHLARLAPGAAFLVAALALAPAPAELAGGDRASFVKNFAEGCQSSPGTEHVIAAFGGAPVEIGAYCACVADIYADRLSIETIDRIREIERLSLADFSRRVCLEELFPGRTGIDPDDLGAMFHPDNVEPIRLLFAGVGEARTVLWFDKHGAGRPVQVLVINPGTGLFCWSRPFGIDREVVDSTPNTPAITALWCEDRAGGYAEVFRIADDQLVVGFSLEDGSSQWLVHDVDLAQSPG